MSMRSKLFCWVAIGFGSLILACTPLLLWCPLPFAKTPSPSIVTTPNSGPTEAASSDANSAKWDEFGGFFGGVSGPILAWLNLLVVSVIAYELHYNAQKHEEKVQQKTRVVEMLDEWAGMVKEGVIKGADDFLQLKCLKTLREVELDAVKEGNDTLVGMKRVWAITSFFDRLKMLMNENLLHSEMTGTAFGHAFTRWDEVYFSPGKLSTRRYLGVHLLSKEFEKKSHYLVYWNWRVRARGERLRKVGIYWDLTPQDSAAAQKACSATFENIKKDWNLLCMSHKFLRQPMRPKSGAQEPPKWHALKSWYWKFLCARRTRKLKRAVEQEFPKTARCIVSQQWVEGDWVKELFYTAAGISYEELDPQSKGGNAELGDVDPSVTEMQQTLGLVIEKFQKWLESADADFVHTGNHSLPASINESELKKALMIKQHDRK